jgi:hypothetical protein
MAGFVATTFGTSRHSSTVRSGTVPKVGGSREMAPSTTTERGLGGNEGSESPCDRGRFPVGGGSPGRSGSLVSSALSLPSAMACLYRTSPK